MSSDKYKMFRNYMCNELGITKADIETWCKEAITDHLSRRLNNIDFPELAMKEASRIAREAVLNGPHYTGGGKQLREELALQLAKNLSVVVKPDSDLKGS